MPKQAAILIRVSTDTQKEHGTSLSQQKSDLLKLAKSLGCTVTPAHLYDDGGYSGSQLAHSERPGLGELIKAAERREFEVVFVQYVDRFGRTTLENLITRNKLKKLGIVIHSYFEGRMENDPAGDLLFMFHSWKAEADNEQRKERSIRGRIASARNGRHSMGHPPYGYKRDFRTKQLSVVETSAKWVRKFYQWCAEDGLSVREICRKANQLRAPLPARRRKHQIWHRSSIHIMLTNPTYTGKVTFLRYDSNGNERPKEEWIPLSVPPIISERLFQKAQNQLKENKIVASRNRKRAYLYAGVLFCGYCRHRLGSGFHRGQHEGTGKYYHGLDSKREIGVGLCGPCPQVAESRLEPVWDAVKSAVNKPEYLRAKVAQYFSRDTKGAAEQRSELEQQVSTVTLQRKKVLRVYVNDDRLDEKEYLRLVHELDDELNRLNEEKREIDERLLGQREKLELSERISHAYRKIRQEVEGASYETRQAIIKKIVNKVIVFERQNEAEIEFHLAPESSGVGPEPSLVSGPSPPNGHNSNSQITSGPSWTDGHKWEPTSVRIRVGIRPVRGLVRSGTSAQRQKLAA
jgi:site-specific DNA recombinase